MLNIKSNTRFLCGKKSKLQVYCNYFVQIEDRDVNIVEMFISGGLLV